MAALTLASFSPPSPLGELVELRRDRGTHEPVIRQERALEPVEHHLAQLGEVEVQLRVEQVQLLRHGRVGDEPVVGVDRDARPEVEVELQRVLARLAHRARLHVGRRAALERDAVVDHVVQQVAVLAQAAAVADAVRPADVQRLGDRRRPVRLAGVDRHVDVVLRTS
jgi:hypothetical protein